MRATMKKLLLVDAHSLLHRAFHAIPPLTSPSGEVVNALYGVAKIITKILREEAPDYVAVLRDLPEPTFRKKEYEAYKATRPKTADELVSQLKRAPELFDAFGIRVFESPGFEADDLIATLVHQFREEDVSVVIVTSDMDALQLVLGDKVVVLAPKGGLGEFTVYNEEGVREKLGVFPRQVVGFKSLVGDQSDNVKGVPGIGPKTAAEILVKYEDIESFFEKGGEEEKYKKFMAFKDDAFRAKYLVELRKDAPISSRPEELLYRGHTEREKEYFEEMGFKSLLREGGTSEKAKKDAVRTAKAQKLF